MNELKEQKDIREYQYFISDEGKLVYQNKRYKDKGIPPMECTGTLKEASHHKYGVYMY